MKRSLWAWSAVLVLLPLDEVTFAPEEEVTLRRELLTTTSLEAESMSFSVDGEEMPIGHAPSMEYTSTETLVFTDTFARVGDGRALELEREFVEVSGRRETFVELPDGGSHDSDEDLSSSLEDRVVRFVWDEEEEEYVAEFADEGDDDETLLDGLVADLDYLRLLPDGEVDEEDSWELDGAALLYVMWPSGRLQLLAEEDDLDDYLDRAGQQLENLEGDGSASYEGTRDEDGVEIALIRFEVEGETYIEQEDDEGGFGTTSISTELEGELLWDVAAGRVHSLSVEGETRIEVTSVFDAEGPNGTVEIEQRRVLAGTIEQSVTIEEE